jgi:hypothetical protein
VRRACWTPQGRGVFTPEVHTSCSDREVRVGTGQGRHGRQSHREPRARPGTPSRAPNRRTPGSTALASGSSGSAGLVDAAWARGHRAISSEGAGGRKAPTVIDGPMSRTRASTPTERVPSPPHPTSAGCRTADRERMVVHCPGPNTQTRPSAPRRLPSGGRRSRRQPCVSKFAAPGSHATQVRTHSGTANGHRESEGSVPVKENRTVTSVTRRLRSPVTLRQRPTDRRRVKPDEARKGARTGHGCIRTAPVQCTDLLRNVQGIR